MKTRLPRSIRHANWRTGDPGYPDGPSVSGSAREAARGRSERSAGRVLATALFCLMVMGVQDAAAATLVVAQDAMASATSCNDPNPTPYTTISMAVAAAGPGDTIIVCPGLYAEQVFIGSGKDNLTVRGAQFGVDARTRAFIPANESIIDHPCGPVQIAADNVVFDGFTVQGSNLDPTVFFACFGSGIWTNPGFLGKQGGHKLRNNIVQNNISGIFLNSTCTNPTLVNFNLIQNNNNSGAGSGNGIDSELGLCNATIDSNKFSGHTNSSMFLVGGQSSISISNNELVGGTLERIVLANTSTSSITGNVSIGSTSSGTVRLFGNNSNVAMSGNTLFNGVRGIRVDDPFAIGANSGITAHFNCIQGNSIAGLQVDAGGHSGTLNAENNWWGSTSGPTHPSNPGGTGDNIIDPDNNVDFMPFLTGCAALQPGKVTGGGQVSVTGGKGSFGFNAKQGSGAGSGHLNYMNHVTGAHLDCSVTAITEFTATTAKFSGTCSPNSSATSFTASVEDHGEPGKGNDKFMIMYGLTNEGGTLISGNIQIHK